MDRLTLAVIAAQQPKALVWVGRGSGIEREMLGDHEVPMCTQCADELFYFTHEIRVGVWKWWWVLPYFRTWHAPICQACCHVFTKGDIWTA